MAGTPPLLIGLTGLPGTGKTALARELARTLRFALLSTDAVAGAIRRADPPSYPERAARLAGPIAGSVAAQQLAIGLGVVLDHAGHRASVRLDWARFAQRQRCAFVLLHTVCPDPAEHRRRVEADGARVRGMPARTWADVESIRARFDLPAPEVPRIDSMRPLRENLSDALAVVARVSQGLAAPADPADH
jgi:predicted kinase